MSHSRVFSQKVHSFTLFNMTSWVYQARKIYLREKFVDVKLFSISCIFVSLLCPTVAFLVNRCVFSPSLKCPRGCTTRRKHLYVKKCQDVRLLWISCIFYCIVLRLALCDNRVNSRQVLRFFPSKMSSRVPHAQRIFLSENFVDVRLLWISFTFHPLNRFAFSYVPDSRF